MAYGLRMINRDGIHHGFKWTLEVGAIIECSDWNSRSGRGNGLHLLPDAQGDWDFLDGYYWVVVEYDPADLVMLGDVQGKVPRCKIVEIQDPENLGTDKLFSYFDGSKFDSRTAFFWADYIGNHDIMIDRVIESEWAYKWAKWIGDRDIMKSRIAEPYWIMQWNLSFPDNQIEVN